MEGFVEPGEPGEPVERTKRRSRRKRRQHRKRRMVVAAVLALLAAAGIGPDTAAAAEGQDAGSRPSFAEGDVLTLEHIERLKPYLPEEFWNNRDFFFYEGMQLEIGPFHADYSPNETFDAATRRYADQVRIGPDNSRENYVAGRSFPNDRIDCLGDPQAGVKIMWNFMQDGGSGSATFYYSYWDRGERLPLYYEGSGRTVGLAHRIEPQYEETGGDMFRGEKRKRASGVEVIAPFDARGISLITYRYKSSDGPRADARNDDTWVYVPSLRRVRRISTAQRTDSISGTDFTMDDLRSFNGVVPQYEWTCLAERELMAPMNTKVKGYPYDKEHNFGPYGLSFADDRWEMRDAYLVRMVPKNDDHPYHHKDIWIDTETYAPLYSFAYDQKEELWKIIWHAKRFSRDESLTGNWFPGWKGNPDPRAVVVVADIIVNVQTGTGNRIEFWDAHGTPLKSKGRVRRYIDVGRLTRGR